MKIISILVSILLGVLLHFLYELTGCNDFIGLFSATNESIWEHLKLSFFPIIIVAIFEYFILKDNVNNFIFSKTIAVIFAMLFTVIVFYTYSGIIGSYYFLVDILIFLLSVVFGQLISYKIMNLPDLNLEKISIIIIIGIIILFGLFTKNPPKIPLFEDPICNIHGSICKDC